MILLMLEIILRLQKSQLQLQLMLDKQKYMVLRILQPTHTE